jgi:hypothetical protein
MCGAMISRRSIRRSGARLPRSRQLASPTLAGPQLSIRQMSLPPRVSRRPSNDHGDRLQYWHLYSALLRTLDNSPNGMDGWARMVASWQMVCCYPSWLCIAALWAVTFPGSTISLAFVAACPGTQVRRTETRRRPALGRSSVGAHGLPVRISM